uniref:U3 small nucleolar RNA-associated protein 6-like protein n=2 Tax=Pararge aegeria TaxID=116150 RepID=S4PWI8_9NEOP
MYAFGISMLKLEDEIAKDELTEILDQAITKNPQYRQLWEEKILLNKSDEKKMLSLLQEAGKSLNSEDSLALWNFMFDIIDSNVVFKACFEKFRTCDNAILLSLKPKLLRKMYEHHGLKATRQIYEEFIRTPPTQVELHKVMIEIEMSQDKPTLKNVRKCYEAFVQHHGTNNIKVWMDYMDFEQTNGSAANVPAVHRRAIGVLEKKFVDDFIKAQMLSKLK